MQENYDNTKEAALAETIALPGLERYCLITQEDIYLCKDCAFRHGAATTTPKTLPIRTASRLNVATVLIPAHGRTEARILLNSKQSTFMTCATLLSGTGEERFPGFAYVPCELLRFHEAADLFTILLQNGDIIHHEPAEPRLFRGWLYLYGVAVVEIEGIENEPI